MKQDTSPVVFQKIESVAIALSALFIYAKMGFAWYWIPLIFIAFDLSALGYVLNTKVGAIMYNAVHNYFLPVSILLFGYASGNIPATVWLVCLVWMFHIAADRIMGYGLKYSDAFTHTHLGTIGKK